MDAEWKTRFLSLWSRVASLIEYIQNVTNFSLRQEFSSRNYFFLCLRSNYERNVEIFSNKIKEEVMKSTTVSYILKISAHSVFCNNVYIAEIFIDLEILPVNYK